MVVLISKLKLAHFSKTGIAKKKFKRLSIYPENVLLSNRGMDSASLKIVNNY